MKRGLSIILLGIFSLAACKKTNPIVDTVVVAKAEFTTDKINYYLTQSTTFNNTSVNGNSYSWDFGDGQKSTDKSPTHVYTSSGTYDVILTVNNSVKASKSIKIFNGSASYQITNLNTSEYTLDALGVDSLQKVIETQLRNYLLSANGTSDTVFTSEPHVIVNATGTPIDLSIEFDIVPYANNLLKLQ